MLLNFVALNFLHGIILCIVTMSAVSKYMIFCAFIMIMSIVIFSNPQLLVLK